MAGVSNISSREGAGSSAATSAETAPRLPEHLIGHILDFLTHAQKNCTSQGSQELRKIAMREPATLLEDLEKFHKGLTELLSDPLIEKKFMGDNEDLAPLAKQVVAELEHYEEMLRSRLKRGSPEEGVSREWLEGERKLSKKEAGIYQELLKIGPEAYVYLVHVMPAHWKVLSQIVTCHNALVGLPPQEIFREWARGGKFELVQMLFETLQGDDQGEFGFLFVKALLEEGDIEHAQTIANTIPHAWNRRKALWEVYRAYLISGDVENALKIAKEDFHNPTPAIDDRDPYWVVINFGDVLQELAVLGLWDRVAQELEIVEAYPEKRSSIAYQDLAQIALSKGDQKENLLRAVEFIKKERDRYDEKLRFHTDEVRTGIARDLMVRHRDYEKAHEVMGGMDHWLYKELGVQIMRVFPLMIEGRIEEAEAIIGAMQEGYIRDRCLSMGAFFFVQQGERERARGYYNQMSNKGVASDDCREGIEKYLFDKEELIEKGK